jgi:hypothetical protein
MTHWTATRPSTEPMANASACGEHDITRVCHFKGDCIVYVKRFKSRKVEHEYGAIYLIHYSRVCQVVNLDMAVRAANHHERIHSVERVASLRQLYCRNRVWSAQIPVLTMLTHSAANGITQERKAHLHGLIPATSDENAALRCVHVLHRLDGHVVRCDLLRRIGVCIQVE